MSDPAPRDVPRSSSESLANGRPARGRIALAFAASLLAHVLVIWSFGLPPPREETRPGFVVQVTGILVSPPVATAPVAPPPARWPAVQEQSAVPPRPATPASAPAAAPDPRDAVPHPSDTPAPPPRPRAQPAAGELARHLLARRLPVTLWVDASGTVTKVEVPLNELSAEVAAKLEQALTGVRVAARQLEEQALDGVLRTRLCFDDAGLLESPSSECLQVEGTPSR